MQKLNPSPLVPITIAGEGQRLLTLETITIRDCPFGGLWLEHNETGEGMRASNESINKLLTKFFEENM